MKINNAFKQSIPEILKAKKNTASTEASAGPLK